MEKKISPAKVVVLGEGRYISTSLFFILIILIYIARVGKTSLTYRFSSGTFNEH